MQEKILRIKQVCERLGGISETTFWRLRKTPGFPQPIIIRGTVIKGWLETSITQWILENSTEVE